jgi:hypothetical protein
MRLSSPADEATRRMRQSVRPSPLQVREGGDPMRLSSPADEATRRMRQSVRSSPLQVREGGDPMRLDCPALQMRPPGGCDSLSDLLLYR